MADQTLSVVTSTLTARTTNAAEAARLSTPRSKNPYGGKDDPRAMICHFREWYPPSRRPPITARVQRHNAQLRGCTRVVGRRATGVRFLPLGTQRPLGQSGASRGGVWFFGSGPGPAPSLTGAVDAASPSSLRSRGRRRCVRSREETGGALFVSPPGAATVGGSTGTAGEEGLGALDSRPATYRPMESPIGTSS